MKSRLPMEVRVAVRIVRHFYMVPSPRLSPEASWRTATKTNPCPVPPQKQQQIRRRRTRLFVTGANFQVVVVLAPAVFRSFNLPPASPASPQREFVSRVCFFPRIASLEVKKRLPCLLTRRRQPHWCCTSASCVSFLLLHSPLGPATPVSSTSLALFRPTAFPAQIDSMQPTASGP
jgi:hypothetical protein